MMPAHVVAYLVDLGRLDADGVTRRARLTRCRRCGAMVFAGLDHDKVALAVRVDPTPLSPVGELSALLTGRVTYELSRGDGYRIDERRAGHIGKPTKADVVAEHACGANPLPDTRSRLKVAQRRDEDAPCPY